MATVWTCCALCDARLSCGENARPKSEICDGCMVLMGCLGHFFGSPGEVATFIETAPEKDVRELLRQVEYQKCAFGENAVDRAVANRFKSP